MVEKYLNNDEPVERLPLIVKAHFIPLTDLVWDVESVYVIEIELYSGDSMGIGGPCDGIRIIDGLNTIFDYKTKCSVQKESYLERYYLQMTAYGRMWTELTGMNIDQIVLFISAKPGFSQVFVRRPEDFEERLNQRIKGFHKINGDKCKHGTSILDECTRCHNNTDLLLNETINNE